MTSASSGEPTTSRGGFRWLSRSVSLAESARTFARCSWCVTDHDPQEAAMNLRGSFLTFLTVATMNTRVVAQGSTPNFNMRELIHVTVNANGVTTASIDNPSMDCN